MAEKYGTIPKRFTKAWWEYFWQYYKWYVIIAVAIIVFITSIIYSKITAPKYDITVTLTGDFTILGESEQKLTREFNKKCADVDGNGESSVFLSQLTISSNPEDAEYAAATVTKLQAMLTTDSAHLFICDETVLKQFGGKDSDTLTFAPLKDWLKADVAEELKYSLHGTPVAVDLTDNSFLKKAGIDGRGKYLVIRYYPRPDQKDQIEQYEAAIELANVIAQNGQ